MGRVRSNPQPRCNTGKVLEMYGDLGEVYLSAMAIRFLTVTSGSISTFRDVSETQSTIPDH